MASAAAASVEGQRTPTKARCSSKVRGHSGCDESSSRTCRATSASSRGTPVEKAKLWDRWVAASSRARRTVR